MAGESRVHYTFESDYMRFNDDIDNKFSTWPVTATLQPFYRTNEFNAWSPKTIETRISRDVSFETHIFPHKIHAQTLGRN